MRASLDRAYPPSSSLRDTTVGINVLATLAGLVPTVYAACVSNSLTLFADVLRCGVECIAVIFTWVVTRHVRAVDRSLYNYGLGKYEQMVSLVVAGAMFVTVCVILFISTVRATNPQQVEGALFGLWLAGFSVFGNSALWWRNAQAQAEDDSPVMDSQRRLFRSKTVASVVVFLSLLVTVIFHSANVSWYADIIGSLALSIFIARSGFDMAYRSMTDILDRSLEETAQLIILGVLVKYEEDFQELIKIRTRRSGNQSFVELFLGFEPHVRVDELCARAERISSAIKEAIPLTDVNIIPRKGN